MSCRATRDWLHRDASSLDEAQRLTLDDHLASCEACRGDRERLRLVREVGASLPVPPAGAREYSRAIARALLEGSRTPAPARRPAWLLPLAIGALAAATIAVIAITRGGDESPRSEQVAPAPLVPPTPAPIPPKPDAEQLAELPLNEDVQPAATTRMRVASIEIVIDAASRLRRTDDRVIVLDAGRVEISAANAAARVITERFEIELTDTSVVVEPKRVQVTRGAVRVVDRSRKLIAQLEAGSDWQPAELHKASPKLDLLKQARAQLAAGKHADAERSAEAFLARSPSRAEEAEARMFLADLAQAAGELEVAVARYEAVATKFADLPAAESALYAAARIEVRRGRAEAARVLFDRYLARYPNGRYADDVRRRQ
jgi:TolA-binding protein